MKKVNVLLNSPEKVGKFIQILQKFNCNFDLESGRGCVDAKSMIGVLRRERSFRIYRTMW